MTREEFGIALRQQRESAGVMLKTMCVTLNVMPTNLYRIEQAKHNFSVQKAIEYLDVSHGEIVLCGNKNHEMRANSLESVLSALKSIIGDASAYSIAPQIGYSRNVIISALNGKTALSIDMFLRLCDHFNVTVSIVPKPE